MYNVSAEFKEIVKGNNRTWRAKAIIDGITHDSTLIRFEFEDRLMAEEGTFSIGQAVSNYTTLTLQDVTGDFDGKKVELFIGLEISDGVVEYLPLGTFYVDKVEQDYNSVELSCFDSMIQFNFTYTPYISFPATIAAVLNDICAIAGVTFSGTLPNILIDYPQGLTAREVIGHIAGLCGGNATFNRSNQLIIREFTSPEIDSDFSISGNDYYTLKRGNGIYTIGKVTGFVTEGTGYSTGTLSPETRELVIQNPFLTQQIIDSIGEKLIGLSYYPFAMDWRGDPSIETGDNITIDEYRGTIFKTIVLSNVLTFNGAISASSKTELEGSIKNEYSSATNVTNVRYTWFKYAEDEFGSNMSDFSTGKTYLGIAYNKLTPIESENPEDYTWSLLGGKGEQGEQGEQGVQGEKGEDGTTLYTWRMYADDELGTNISDIPTGKRYLGLAINKLTPIPSLNPLDYSWSPLFDNVLVGGRNLLLNTATPQTKAVSGWVATNWVLSDLMQTGQHTVSFKYTTSVPAEIGINLGVNGASTTYALTSNLPSGTNYFKGTAYFERTDQNTLAIYTNQTITIWDLQLEQGNVATTYNLSPEDEHARLGEIETSIETANNEIALKVSKGNLISEINASVEGIRISAPKLDLQGYVTITALGQQGATVINGANITTGTISADKISGGTLSGVTLDVGTTATVGTVLNIGQSSQQGATKDIRFNSPYGGAGISFVPSQDTLNIYSMNVIDLSASEIDFNNATIVNFRGVPVFG